jgi:hypothetical protein
MIGLPDFLVFHLTSALFPTSKTVSSYFSVVRFYPVNHWTSIEVASIDCATCSLFIPHMLQRSELTVSDRVPSCCSHIAQNSDSSSALPPRFSLLSDISETKLTRKQPRGDKNTGTSSCPILFPSLHHDHISTILRTTRVWQVSKQLTSTSIGSSKEHEQEEVGRMGSSRKTFVISPGFEVLL